MLNKTFTAIDEDFKKAELSMTPLIDMIFILLIFFVVTTTFTKETGINVDKARAATSVLIDKELILVSIHENGGYWYDGQERDLDGAVSLIRAAHTLQPDARIVVVPDKNGRIEPLVTLLDQLRASNISQFSLGTKP